MSGVLNKSHEHIDKINNVRQHINNTFENLKCSLLPYAGNKIVLNNNSNKYNGNHGDMEIEFKKELKNIIENIFEPKSFVIKKINNVALTAEIFRVNAKSYLDLFFKIKMEIKIKSNSGVAHSTQLKRRQPIRLQYYNLLRHV